MESKPRLLITMGCSFTEGVGCFDYSILEKDVSEYTEGDKEYVHNNSLRYMLNNSWGSQLQEMLNYESFLNLGKGNASNSESAKLLFDKYYDNYFSQYEVLVIWLMSYSHRLSYYSGGHPKIYSHNNIIHDEVSKIQSNLDAGLEDLFYLRAVQSHADSKGWKFLFSHVEGETLKVFRKYYKHQIPRFIDLKLFTSGLPPEKTSKICPHPNEIGYRDLATNIYDWIHEYRGELISGNEVTDYYKERDSQYYFYK